MFGQNSPELGIKLAAVLDSSSSVTFVNGHSAVETGKPPTNELQVDGLLSPVSVQKSWRACLRVDAHHGSASFKAVGICLGNVERRAENSLSSATTLLCFGMPNHLNWEITPRT
jgi:hypothetical protein